MAITYSVCEDCKRVNKVNLDEATYQAPVCGVCRTKLPIRGEVNQLTSYTALASLANKSPLPVVIDFWADWCAPCQSFVPIFEQAAHEFAGRVVFAKFDMDTDPKAGDAYVIKSIPTTVVISKGTELKRETGAMTAAFFKAWLAKLA